MATRCALGLLCLVAIAANVNSAVQTKYVKVRDNLEIGRAADYGSTVESCIVQMNNGSTITLYPSSEANDNHKFSLDQYDKCRTHIYSMDEKDSGNWKMVMSLKDKKTVVHEYNVNVRQMLQEKLAYPTSSIKVYKNQLVAVHFNEKFENLDSCKIISPQNKEYDLSSDKSTNIKLYGGCGVKMYITNNEADYNGKWMLIADLKNKSAFYSTFSVFVKDLSDLNPPENVFIFKRGEDASITFGEAGLDASKMCILENPKGEKMPITSGPCIYKIPAVSENHEGSWTAYYGVEGTETLVKQKITVKTYADRNLNSSITVSPNGDVHLLCKIRTSLIKFCSFERPDGQLLHMSNGVGNDKYEYYGNGISDEERWIATRSATYDCGITIRKPNTADFGTWKCLIGINDKPKIVGKILKVAPPAMSNVVIKSIPKSKDVYAKRGTSMKVKCSANEALSYCWLRSPNGTVYSIISDKMDTPQLKYEGQGFDLGDCSVSIENANYSDAGRWTCHMGVVNGPELETSFKVHIKETHLMADQSLIILDKNRGSDLVCRPLPDSDKVIESCRWVNPAGQGINVDTEGRYITQTESTHCRLSFRVINLNDDVGKWSCFARFGISNLEEESLPATGSARITVAYNMSSLATFLSVALVVSLLVCITLGVFILVQYKRRILRRHIDENIILDEKLPKYP